MNASEKIDEAYARLAPGIREIVEKVRSLIHKADPTIEETWKWGPAFEKNGLMLGLWGFKKHVSFVFYRGAEMKDRHQLFNDGLDNARNRMIKFTSLKEVDEKKLIDYVKEAVKLNASGKHSSAKAVEKGKQQLVVPAALKSRLAKNAKAKKQFESLAFTYRKEMVQLVAGARQEETRERRLDKIMKALSAGKKSIS